MQLSTHVFSTGIPHVDTTAAPTIASFIYQWNSTSWQWLTGDLCEAADTGCCCGQSQYHHRDTCCMPCSVRPLFESTSQWCHTRNWSLVTGYYNTPIIDFKNIKFHNVNKYLLSATAILKSSLRDLWGTLPNLKWSLENEVV